MILIGGKHVIKRRRKRKGESEQFCTKKRNKQEREKYKFGKGCTKRIIYGGEND